MKLKTLLQGIVTDRIHNCAIQGLTLDSREVKAGFLFIALPGEHVDGRHYIADAAAKGAAAILYEARGRPVLPELAIPCIKVVDLGYHMAKVAARFYGEPAEKLHSVGITGTNGKSSCCHFINQALSYLGHPCGLIGTLGYGFLTNLQKPTHTTPDAVTLQKQLAALVAEGAEYVAMEVSSHALLQQRIARVPLEIGVFTNLSQEHQDYHLTMDNYAFAKSQLFQSYGMKYAVINLDDPRAQFMLQSLPLKIQAYGYTLNPQREAPLGIPSIRAVKMSFVEGLWTVQVDTPWGELSVKNRLMGQFNQSNLLAVLTVLALWNTSLKDIALACEQLTTVPGRMEALGGSGAPLVVIDYAHTPDALENALKALKPHCRGQLFCLFGCGGARDKVKRPEMARIAERYADKIYVTNDNPRTESPAAIVQDILAGFSKGKVATVIYDRKVAIQTAITTAYSGDVVLIAGKGHESYQQIGQEKIPFSDRDVVYQMLND